MRVRLLTPAGTAALGVLAVEGVAGRVAPLRTVSGAPLDWPAPGRFRHARLVLVDAVDGDGECVVDDVVVCGTEQGAELHLHGGPGVLRAALSALGEPDVVTDAGSEPGCLRAARAMASSRAGPLRDLADDARDALRSGVVDPSLRRRLTAALGRTTLARRLARPPVVRIVGRPNAGKSTLFNALLLEERALVSPRSGTTRDSVVATMLLEDVPVILEDTAGEPAVRAQTGADLLLHLRTDRDEPRLVATPGRPVLTVLGRVDLRTDGRPGVSGLTRAGVPGLAARLAATLGLPGTPEDDACAPILGEQRALFRRVLSAAPGATQDGVPPGCQAPQTRFVGA